MALPKSKTNHIIPSQPQHTLTSNASISQLIATGGKPIKTPARPMLTEIIPNKLFISNLEGSQDVSRIIVCYIDILYLFVLFFIILINFINYFFNFVSKQLKITHVVAVLKTKMNNIYPDSIQRLWVYLYDFTFLFNIYYLLHLLLLLY
jgi:hypothetical protein